MKFTRSLLINSLLLILILCFIHPASAAPKPLTVVLDWLVNADHAPLLVALDQGFFTEEGLSVTLINPTNPDDPPKLVALNKADLAISYQPELMIQVDKGLPLVRIATLIATPLNSLVTLADSNIHSIADLKGKKIASSSGANQQIMLDTLLKKHGLSPDDVTIINVHYNLLQALLSRQVDAVTGLMRNIEFIELQRLHQRILAFYPEEEGMPSYEELIIIANTKHINDPRLSAFVRALERGIDYLINHPEESFQRASIRYPELNTPSAHDAWMATLIRFAKRPSAVDYGRYRRYAAFLTEHSIIKKALPVKSYAIDLQEN